MKELHQQQIQPAVRADQRVERRRHHHGRQDERQGGSHP
jgi:hypothetical protein